MLGVVRYFLFIACLWPLGLLAADEDQGTSTDDVAAPTDAALEQTVNTLEEPLYNAFVERYVLDELKQLRTDLGNQRADIIQQILDREHKSVDRAVSYATDTVTYFFYLVAAASSILVIVGWTSIRDIKERVHSFANEEIAKLITEYESRLANIEKQLRLKTQDIEENREALEQTKEIQSLWLRAQQENNPSSKIQIYDQILKQSPEDSEALTYKADAVLELNESQWAVNLCNQALMINPENAHAYYQLACAYCTMGYFEDALKNVEQSIHRNETYRDDIMSEVMLEPLRELNEFQSLFVGERPQ